MKIKQILAIDMDGVLADTETQYIKWYQKEFGVEISPDTLAGKPEGEGFPEKEAIWRFLNTPGFFRTLPLMPGAVEAVAELMNHFEIYIVSAAMEFPLSLPEKFDWLKEHFSFIPWTNIVFCGNKSIIRADYLIDDHLKNLDNFKGKALMFHASHNTTVTHHQRVKNWPEIVILLKAE